METRSAIVTGATGFIGSWLVSELLDNGYKVTVLVRDESGLLREIADNPQCTVVEKNILDTTSDDISDRDFSVGFHLAWGGVDTKHKNDLNLQLENIRIALKVMELYARVGCKKLIASGTVAEYVFSEDIMNLNSRQTPNDFYGAAKVSAHYFLEVRARQLKQDFIWAVIPSTFGERRKDNNIITYTIKSLLKKEIPKYGNLEQMWDFLYVSEVARALRMIGEEGKPGKVYGIGSGQYRRLKDYIETIRDLIDPALELGIGEVPSMSEQTFSSCVNTYDLIRDTGFSPKVSFEEGIKRTIDYWKNEGES